MTIDDQRNNADNSVNYDASAESQIFKHQATLSDILMTIKNIKQDRDRLRPNQVTENLNENLDMLDHDSLSECKTQIISSIYGLMTIYPQKTGFLDQQRVESIASLINFIVKMYQLDPQVQNRFNQELNITESVEL